MAGVIELLEQRIAALENRIFGEDGKSTIEGSILDNVHSVKQKVTSLTTGKEKTHTLWKRLEELNSYLDPEMSNKLSLGNEAKADIILAEEEQLTAQAALLEKVKELSSVLDSEHINAVPGMSDKLIPLAGLQVEQQERSQELGEEARKLLDSYNTVIALISQQFVQWDQIMTRYEVARKIRQPDEY